LIQHQVTASPAAHTAEPSDDNHDVAAFQNAIRGKLVYELGKSPADAGQRDWFVATALATRDRIVERWMATRRQAEEGGAKQVAYLSVEFLIGRLLMDALGNLGLTETARAALAGFGIDLETLRASEPDAALGNGGLGRLAACFMESMASLSIPAVGYGIRYDHGLFRQVISDGWQHEQPEDWLAQGNPWEFKRSELVYPVHFGGVVEYVGGDAETARAVWHPGETVFAMAYDTPIVGWRGDHVNTLRLWSARAPDPLHLERFNRGDFLGALADRARAEAISRVLYPSDETPSGQELRLRQEFFFTSASLQDLLRRHLAMHSDVASLPQGAAVQLNDTHPAIAVAELMRLLVDEHDTPWARAWDITRAVLSYTNHTLMPEALEKWPVDLMARLLPRHMQIIYLINWRHLRETGQPDMSVERLRAISIIDEDGGKSVRMGHLAFIGAHRTNGVSALHTDLLGKTVFHDLDTILPNRIVNKTNGITFRRWLYQANPGLTRLLVEALSEHVLDDPAVLTHLDAFAEDAGFVDRLRQVRRANKQAFIRIMDERVGVRPDPAMMFDVQIKRIHEYKRQLLNLIETAALHGALREDSSAPFAPRVKIFAGKAAASYHRAKLIIKLANDIARMVNADPAMRGRLAVAFLPNYNVSLAERIVPAADLSEQISTAGLEASGTGNMKLALNGALTIGTLDGANVEIRDHVGEDNIFIFGMNAADVAIQREEAFTGAEAASTSPRLREALERIAGGFYSPEEPDRYKGLVEAVLAYDPFMVAADFDAYWDEQREVDAVWARPQDWWRRSVFNTARMGWFSSDRTIREYAQDIWGVATKG
jgi:starch phosphorylase